MAEVAAGAVVAEQVVSTTIEGGVIAGYAISKATLPLKATFHQIGKTDSKFLNDSTLALARSHHSLNIIDDKAYIFGGEFSPNKLCSNDIHVIALPSKQETPETQYSCIPAVAEGEVPCARSRHAMCVQGHELALFGGCDEKGHAVDQDSCVWVWNSEKLIWRKITTSSHASQNAGTPPPRFDHKLFAYGGHLILHGGRSSKENVLNDTWFLDLTSNTWTQLPDAPVHSDSVILVDGTLYTIAQLPTESFCHVHTLEIGSHVPASDPSTLLTSLQWQSVSSSSEDLPPRSRVGAGLIPITTGYGRQYLTYFFGTDSDQTLPSSPSTENQKETPEPTFYSDFWTYQIASKSVKPNSWTDFKPAAIKDSIRNAIGKSSGAEEWAEVEVQATEQMGHEGKVHPGPRAFFGSDVGADGRSVVLWGGVNAKGEKEGDGWLISLE